MIDLAEARRIAYEWHGGGGSPLYSFASTGDVANITPEAFGEACDCIGGSDRDAADLERLRDFLAANMTELAEDYDPDGVTSVPGFGQIIL